MALLDPKSTAFIFPGQGSQSIGMGRDLALKFPSAQQVFDQADRLLGFQVSKLAWEGPEDELNDTINTQPALLAHSYAVLRVFEEKFPGFRPAYVAGHSMGELSALVASNALSFEDCIRLARRRGELMKEAGQTSPGGMAAALGAEINVLENICKAASNDTDVVQVANDNCPGQVVISGSSRALAHAIQLAQAAGVRKIRPLAVSIAAHSPLMIQAQEGFFQAVSEIPLRNPDIPLIGNVSAEPLQSAAEIQNDLHLQLTSRVRWTETIQQMAGRGIILFIELGSGAVLSGLLKRIDENLQGISLGSPDDFNKLETI